jgi:hypothetical protein
MKSYDEYLADAGIDKNDDGPGRKYVYYAYKGGKSYGPFFSREEAKAISSNIEGAYCPEQDKIYSEWEAARRPLIEKAHDNYQVDLRARHSDLPDKIFQITYSWAYDEGHSAGYDEVSACLYGAANFAKEVMAAMLEK